MRQGGGGRVNPSSTLKIKKPQKVHNLLSIPRVLTYRHLFIPLKKFPNPWKCVSQKLRKNKKTLLVSDARSALVRCFTSGYNEIEENYITCS